MLSIHIHAQGLFADSKNMDDTCAVCAETSKFFINSPTNQFRLICLLEENRVPSPSTLCFEVIPFPVGPNPVSSHYPFCSIVNDSGWVIVVVVASGWLLLAVVASHATPNEVSRRLPVDRNPGFLTTMEGCDDGGSGFGTEYRL
ncbi:hypothetical protein M8C21_031032 [Ambrosia artemisiifolia]|uniref:Uncharacterized protein n=1 Tax=Ambrosia artemisiifolia TaxID=4212 RepID=A0AAD5GJR9_AMBAR|nr:hypothetical protein M8C21_031032 [Ambrosia artemisiifolia]